MIVYITKDWTGPKVFVKPPVLVKCGGMPDIWWSVVNRVK